MIKIQDDSLQFRFPEVHRDAGCTINFQRTLRIPDDGTVHFLPPGVGNFPLRNVDLFPDRVPAHWRERGGVMLPMFQSEAMWLDFWSYRSYPCLVKIAAGGVNAITGETWSDVVTDSPQNYVVVPGQPWLDGFCVKKGEIRQFVAMPLGQGYTAEEQVTGRADVGGLQIVVYPLKASAWEKLQREQTRISRDRGIPCCQMLRTCASVDMGLGAGGRMRQEIFDDEFDFDDWDLEHPRRCFVHIANSLTWRAITGETPPILPPTAEQYAAAGLPWFDWYDESRTALVGSAVLAGVKTVKELGEQKGEVPLPENNAVGKIQLTPLGPGRVREWAP
jgi:hypothetical protein